jgi:hypothetical protein
MSSKLPFILPLLLVTLYTANGYAGVDTYRLYLAQSGQIPWQSLTPEEQAALKRYRNQWNNYPGERQQEMQRGAQRYLELPPQKRREVEQQQRQYRDMTPEERRRLREQYKRERR